MTRPDYCPISNAPCQSMCTTSCKARKPLTPAQRRALIDRAGDITDGLNQDDFAEEIVKLVERHHGISAIAQPSTEPSKPEQAEAPGDSDPLTPEQEEWVMDLAEKHNLGRRVSQIGTMRGVAPDVFYTDASYRTHELFSFAAELLSTKEQS